MAKSRPIFTLGCTVAWYTRHANLDSNTRFCLLQHHSFSTCSHDSLLLTTSMAWQVGRGTIPCLSAVCEPRVDPDTEFTERQMRPDNLVANLSFAWGVVYQFATPGFQLLQGRVLKWALHVCVEYDPVSRITRRGDISAMLRFQTEQYLHLDVPDNECRFMPSVHHHGYRDVSSSLYTSRKRLSDMTSD